LKSAKTNSAQAIAVEARNFLACRGGQLDFLAPATSSHRLAEKFLAARFASFAFLLFWIS
jgi:hypothetical protein